MKTEQGSNTVKTKQGSRELLLLELWWRGSRGDGRPPTLSELDPWQRNKAG
jgi:hypothetical protein